MGERAAPISRRYTAGKDIVLTFTVSLAGSPVDITGMTPRFIAQRRYGSSAPAISTEASPATAVAAITDAANGVFTITIDGDDTASLFGTYRFECEVEDVSGNKTSVANGFITFAKSLT